MAYIILQSIIHSEASKQSHEAEQNNYMMHIHLCFLYPSTANLLTTLELFTVNCDNIK